MVLSLSKLTLKKETANKLKTVIITARKIQNEDKAILVRDIEKL